MNTNRIFAIGTAVAIAAILGLGWLVGLSPLLASAAQADQERLLVEQTNQVQQATLASMKADFERLDEIEADLYALRVAIPSEVDSDVIYDYLARIQAAVPTRVESIVTGEALPYGVSVDAPDAAPGEAGETAGVAQFEGLYTVPVTITFPKGTSVTDAIALAGALQNGPRIFLVTAITRPASSDGSAGTLTAFMFVMSERDETPGSSAGDHDPSLDKYTRGAIARWGSDGEVIPTPTPTPGETETPAPTDSPSPTPTP
jgi:hypothetical protein